MNALLYNFYPWNYLQKWIFCEFLKSEGFEKPASSRALPKVINWHKPAIFEDIYTKFSPYIQHSQYARQLGLLFLQKCLIYLKKWPNYSLFFEKLKRFQLQTRFPVNDILQFNKNYFRFFSAIFWWIWLRFSPYIRHPIGSLLN